MAYGSVLEMEATVNAAQVQRWNGASAQHWIAHRQRHLDIRRELIPRLLDAAGIATGDRVLDVGCGCGETTVLAARAAGPTGRALGVDLSEPMLAVARELAVAERVANVEFRAADAQVHAFAPGSFDVVLSSFGVMFFDDPAAAFANLLRAMGPGARLAFLCWQGGQRNELFGLPRQALDANDVRRAPVDWGPFADPEWIADLVATAGGTDVEVESIESEPRASAPTSPTWWTTCSAWRPTAPSWSPSTKRRPTRVTETLAALLAARQRPDGVWVRVAARLVRASRRSA